MTANLATRSYQRTNVTTADNLKLIIMCYDAAIRDLEEAKRSQQGRHLQATYDRIRHAQDIVTELLVGLDYERGGTIAQNLSRIYNYVLRQLIGLNTNNKDLHTYDHLIGIMGELRSAWEGIRDQSGTVQPMVFPTRGTVPGVFA